MGQKLSLDVLKLLESVEVKVFHAMEAYSSLAVTKVTCNIKRHSKRWKGKGYTMD
jgi:hypothetical protein